MMDWKGWRGWREGLGRGGMSQKWDQFTEGALRRFAGCAVCVRERLQKKRVNWTGVSEERHGVRWWAKRVGAGSEGRASKRVGVEGAPDASAA